MFRIALMFITFISFQVSLFSQETTDTIWSRLYPEILDAVITPDKTNAIVAIPGSIQILDSKTGELIYEIQNTDGIRNKLAVSNDSRYLYSSRARKWDLISYELLYDYSDSYYGTDISLSEDNERLFLVSSSRGEIAEKNRIVSLNASDLSLINSKGDSIVDQYQHNRMVIISNDNKKLIISGREEKVIQPDQTSEFRDFIRIYDPNTFELVETIVDYKSDFYRIDDLRITSDSENVSFTEDGDLKYFNFTSKLIEKKLIGNESLKYRQFDYSANDKHLFLSSYGQMGGRLFSIPTFEEVLNIPHLITEVHDFEGDYVLCGSSYFLHFYDLSNIINSVIFNKVENLIFNQNYISFHSKSNLNISIYDYLGNRHYSNNHSVGESTIDISTIKGGYYFFTISNGQSIQTIKFFRR